MDWKSWRGNGIEGVRGFNVGFVVGRGLFVVVVVGYFFLKEFKFLGWRKENILEGFFLDYRDGFVC